MRVICNISKLLAFSVIVKFLQMYENTSYSVIYAIGRIYTASSRKKNPDRIKIPLSIFH